MAFIFKKKKTPKQYVQGLLECMETLPSKSKVEAVAKVAVANAEAPTGKRFERLSLRAGQSAGAGGTGSEEVVAPHANADGAVGVGDGLSPTDLASLDGLEKRLAEVKSILCGTAESPPKDDESTAVAKILLEHDIPMRLLEKLDVVTFETRKDVMNVFNYLLQIQTPQDLAKSISKYLKQRSKKIIELLLGYYSMENIALHAGAIMRQCLIHQSLYEECLTDDQYVLNQFFDKFLQMDSFEIVSDAFATFRDILLKQKQLIAAFLEKNYEKFFPKYNTLLKSEHYVTQRQSLNLLSALLLDRQNYNTMIRYIGDKENLILVMNLMRVRSPAMRLEAFHVFKIFVANPNKTEPIIQILQRNRDKLIAYLENYTPEREEETMQDERKLLIKTMKLLPPAPENVNK